MLRSWPLRSESSSSVIHTAKLSTSELYGKALALLCSYGMLASFAIPSFSVDTPRTRSRSELTVALENLLARSHPRTLPAFIKTSGLHNLAGIMLLLPWLLLLQLQPPKSIAG